MKILSRLTLLLVLASAAAAFARVKNPDLNSLYDVTRHAKIVVEGPVVEIDAPRQVITLEVQKLWHGELPPETGQPARVRYEVRGSLDAYRVGRVIIEFLDPNLPYGTQDPKTIMAPIKPRSVRNRVVEETEPIYAAFVRRYLELTAADRGTMWSEALQDHLLAALESPDDRTRQAAGESLHDVLTLSDLNSKPAREVLGSKGIAAVAAVLRKGDRVLTASDRGPGVPLMKLAMVLGEARLAGPMIQGVLYLPQAGVDPKDAIEKALALDLKAANAAVREEYAKARTDGYREQLISVLAAIGGDAGERFLWERIENEKNQVMRQEALLAYACLPQPQAWPRLLSVYGKEAEDGQRQLLGRIAGCHPNDAAAGRFLLAELESPREGVRRAAAFANARRGVIDAQPVLVGIVDACRAQEHPTLDCLSAMDALRRLQTPEAIAALERAATSDGASSQFKDDARRFLQDIRRMETPGI